MDAYPHLNGKRFLLSVTNDLVTDQRVHRSCMALLESGCKVTLIGRLLPDSTPLSRPYKTVRMRLLFKKKAFFYAEYNIRLFFKMLCSPCDALYANDTDTLPAVYCAARLRHKPLFFDAHEMFPEVPELVARPAIKRVWSRLEDFFFPRMKKYPYGAACCTVCQSIADIYKDKYGLSMQVVRNVPIPHEDSSVWDGPLLDFEGREIPVSKDDKILLYQGAVNLGRGIEYVIDAMPLLDHCIFLIAGTGDIFDSIRQRIADKGVKDKVFLLGRQPLELLHKLTRMADLGISLLDNLGLNYYYSLPNRLADFIQAEVPVLATDFPEIRRVIAGYNVGTLIPDSDTQPAKIAAVIQQSLNEWASLSPDVRHSRFAPARKNLSWLNDKKILLSTVHTIFSNKMR